MLRLALIAALALSFASLDAANAASKRKRQHVQAVPAPVYSTPAPPPYARTPGPVWAGPGECYTDEGYGRYTACGAGRGGE